MESENGALQQCYDRFFFHCLPVSLCSTVLVSMTKRCENGSVVANLLTRFLTDDALAKKYRSGNASQSIFNNDYLSHRQLSSDPKLAGVERLGCCVAKVSCLAKS